MCTLSTMYKPSIMRLGNNLGSEIMQLSYIHILERLGDRPKTDQRQTADSLHRCISPHSFRFLSFKMSEEWDNKLVIGQKKVAPKVTKKETDLNTARRNGAVVATDKKITAGSNKAHQSTDHQRIAKLDRENEVAPPSKILPSVGRAMQTARMDLKLSQKDVAQKINEKPSILQDYEAGKAIPNPQILGKLERVLGVKLRGSDIGKKLDGSKKA